MRDAARPRDHARWSRHAGHGPCERASARHWWRERQRQRRCRRRRLLLLLQRRRRQRRQRSRFFGDELLHEEGHSPAAAGVGRGVMQERERDVDSRSGGIGTVRAREAVCVTRPKEARGSTAAGGHTRAIGQCGTVSGPRITGKAMATLPVTHGRARGKYPTRRHQQPPRAPPTRRDARAWGPHRVRRKRSFVPHGEPERRGGRTRELPLSSRARRAGADTPGAQRAPPAHSAWRRAKTKEMCGRTSRTKCITS